MKNSLLLFNQRFRLNSRSYIMRPFTNIYTKFIKFSYNIQNASVYNYLYCLIVNFTIWVIFWFNGVAALADPPDLRPHYIKSVNCDNVKIYANVSKRLFENIGSVDSVCFETACVVYGAKNQKSSIEKFNNYITSVGQTKYPDLNAKIAFENGEDMSAVKSRWEQRLKSQIASFISKEPENVANLFLEGTRDISATCARLERK